jgi:hypothetical protein
VILHTAACLAAARPSLVTAISSTSGYKHTLSSDINTYSHDSEPGHLTGLSQAQPEFRIFSLFPFCPNFLMK